MAEATNRDFHVEYQGLPSLVLGALYLLWPVRDKALKGVGNYDCRWCPMAKAYGGPVVSKWELLDTDIREKLAEARWSETLYNNFLIWHDTKDYRAAYCYEIEAERKRRADILRWFLSQPVMPTT